MTWNLYKDTEAWKTKRKKLKRAQAVDPSVLDVKLANLMRNVNKTRGEASLPPLSTDTLRPTFGSLHTASLGWQSMRAEEV